MDPYMQPRQFESPLEAFWQRHKRAIVAGLIFLGIGVALYLWFTRETPREPIAYKNIEIPAIILDGTSIDNDSIKFFNHRNFIDYSLTQGSSKKLFPEDLSYPEIENVSWSPSGKYVVFTSSQHTVNDVLGKKLKGLNKSLNSAYWWLLDTEQKTTQFIAPNTEIEQAVWRPNNNLIFKGYSDAGEGDDPIVDNIKTPVYSYDFSKNKLNRFADIKITAKQILATNSDLYYIEAVSDNSYKLLKQDGGKTTEIIHTNSDDINVSADGRYTYYFRYNDHTNEAVEEGSIENFHLHTPGGLGSVVVMETTTKNEVERISDISSEALFSLSEPEAFWALSTDAEADLNLTRYGLADDTEKNYIVQEKDTSIFDMISLEFVNGSMFIKTPRGFGIVGDNNFKPLTSSFLLSPKKSVNPSSPFLVTQIERDRSIVVTIFAKPASSRSQALEYIGNQIFDPNLVRIEFDESALDDPTRPQ